MSHCLLHFRAAAPQRPTTAFKFYGPGWARLRYKVCSGRAQFERINLRLNKRMASTWVTARDKLLEKRVIGLNNEGCMTMVFALVLYGENGKSFLNLSSTRVGNLHFIPVVCVWRCALGIALRRIFFQKQESSKSRLCNMIYIMSCYTF